MTTPLTIGQSCRWRGMAVRIVALLPTGKVKIAHAGGVRRVWPEDLEVV